MIDIAKLHICRPSDPEGKCLFHIYKDLNFQPSTEIISNCVGLKFKQINCVVSQWITFSCIGVVYSEFQTKVGSVDSYVQLVFRLVRTSNRVHRLCFVTRL